MNRRTFLPALLVALALAAALVPSAALAAAIGHVDSPVPNGPPFPGQIPVRGWALLPGSSAQLQVRVVENGAVVGGGLANLYSPVTAQQWGSAYANRGFDFPISLPPGDHFLTVLAVEPNGAAVPLDPCQNGPIHVRVGSGNGGGMVRGAFTAPLHGQPTTSSFDLQGFLVDDANPGRTVSGVIKYRSDVDAERTISVVADLPRSDVGPHGFSTHLVLTTSRHWYMNLFALDGNGGLVPVGMLNLDLVCPVANVAPSSTICAGTGRNIGAPPPTLYGDPWTWRWTPTAGLSDPNVSNPFASPATTTTYTLVVTDPAGACSATKSTTVTVVATSATATAAPAGCAATGGSVAVSLGGSVSGASGATWAWDFTSDGSWDVTGLSSPQLSRDYAAGSWTATLRAVSPGTASTPSCTATASVSFVVSSCPAPAGCAPRSVGYWSHQFAGDPAQQESACDLRAAVEAASPLFPEGLPAASDRCAQWEEILSTGGGSLWDRAVRQQLGLRLNVASGKVGAERGISLSYSTSTTVAAAMAEVEAILLDGAASSAELERAKDIAEALDLGCGYDPACETPDTTCEPQLAATKNADGTISLEWTAGATRTHVVERGSSPSLQGDSIVVEGTRFTDDPAAGGRKGDLLCWMVSRP